jgi:hypothetical protein
MPEEWVGTYVGLLWGAWGQLVGRGELSRLGRSVARLSRLGHVKIGDGKRVAKYNGQVGGGAVGSLGLGGWAGWDQSWGTSREARWARSGWLSHVDRAAGGPASTQRRSEVHRGAIGR